MATTPQKSSTAPKADEKKTRASKRDKAQKALDVIVRKIENVDRRLGKAQQDVTDLTAEREALLREKDYAANHPALAETEPTPDAPAPGELPGTEV